MTRSENEIAIEALVLFRRYCSQGDFARDLNAWLGIDILQKQPALLIEALAKEGNSVLIHELAESMGSSTSQPFADCHLDCLPRGQDFFRKKAEALLRVDMSELSDSGIWMRSRLLAAIEEARREWENSLRSQIAGGAL